MSGRVQVAILGSGSAIPDPARGNASQAVIVGDDVLLFDCGERTSVNLVRAGINPLHVTRLFFTHLHWDHTVDFAYLIMSSWSCGRREPLPTYGPAGTLRMVEAEVFGAHEANVDFFRAYARALPDHITQRPAEDPPVEAHELEVGDVVEGQGWRVLAGEVEHHQRIGMPSIGYRVETAEGVVAISGDTSPCKGMVELARDADVLVHDCAFPDEIIEQRGMWSHSGPTGAGRVAREAGARLLVLTHLGPYTSPQPTVDMAAPYYGPRRDERFWDEQVAAARREFDGPVVLAEDAMRIDVATGDVQRARE